MPTLLSNIIMLNFEHVYFLNSVFLQLALTSLKPKHSSDRSVVSHHLSLQSLKMFMNQQSENNQKSPFYMASLTQPM